MVRRIAGIIILLTPVADTSKVNKILSQHSNLILGRMGLNLPDKNFRVISLVVVANTDEIGALSGKLGLLPGVQVKTAILKPINNGNDLSSRKIQDSGSSNGTIY